MQFNWPLIGHDNIKKYFEKALSAGRVHHAYLFEGPAQVGKATFARMLAATLLCEGGVAGDRISDASEIRSPNIKIPCGNCRACEAFKHGAHPDYLALDRGEEEHISIEQTREFVAALATKPLLGPTRIGMIEEAGLLTIEAGSALLKTIEEPGASAVLFLITDRSVLQTIASRCQRIRFGFVGAQELEKSLDHAPRAQEIAAFACGRPGLALALKDPAVWSDALEAVREAEQLLSSDERTRLLWIIEQFSGRASMPQRRQRCQQFTYRLQQVLRGRFSDDLSLLPILKRGLDAESYLKANVDPRLIMEYVLLANH